MALHDYPLPDLDITLQEAGRVLQLTLSPDLYMQYKNALSQQREILQEAQRKLSEAGSGRENWVTEQFKSRLLSCGDALPTSTAIPTVLPQSKAWKNDTQLGRAAALVWAMAKLYSEPWLVEGDVPMERTQQSEVFAASRLPGKKQDEIKLYPDSVHAILTSRAGAFPIQILHRPSAEGPFTALSLGDIYDQIEHISNLPAAGTEQDASAICALSSQPRRDWHSVREKILKKGGPTAASLDLMESAILAVSLEDGPAPPDVASTLNAIRLGGRGWNCLRFYDKVVNMVVFKDSAAGLLFEHSAVDGMVAGLVAERKDLMEGVECAVGNVYARDQLAVTYLGRKDRVRMVLNGKGSFASILDKLHTNLQVTLKLIMLLALRYAVAGQMGALECILQGGDEFRMNVNTEARIHRGPNVCSKLPQSSEMKPDFTLVIHGGAGEDVSLNQKVVEVLEFALETALSLGAQVLRNGGSSLDAVERSVVALEDCFLFNAGKGAVYNKDGQHELEASIVDGNGSNSGSVACLRTVKNPVKAARQVMEKSVHSLLVGDGAEEFLQGLPEKDKPVGAEYFDTDVRHRELDAKLNSIQSTKNNHPQTVGAVALDRWGKLAAATSTGGLVGKWKGRVGDTAVVGAGVYADEKVAVTCSGDGDVFLRQTVAQRVASLYSHKGYTLQQACREVISENLKGCQAGIIAVDHKGQAVIETNAAVMFVASMVNNTIRAEVFKPAITFSNTIWETNELVAYLQPDPWTPGATVLTRKSFSGPCSIFQLTVHDFITMLLGARRVANLLCEQLGVHRCALVVHPQEDQPAQIKVLPLHGLEPSWRPHLAGEEEFNPNDPGYCCSKSGPRCKDAYLDSIQAKIRAKLPTPNAPSCYDFLGDPSHNNLFSRIVRGEEKQWRVWEDNSHVAFLTPFPNTPGLTVLVPRKPLSSDIFRLEEADYTALILAARKVAQLLQEGMRAQGVALIFEGFEIDYAHAKLIPLVALSCPEVTAVPPQFSQTYPGFVTSANGPPASPEELKKVHTQITQNKAPRSWENPQSHATLAITNQWYRNLFQIQSTLFHSTVEYFHNICHYAYALTPITTDTISSPMGLGSDSEPVFVNMLGQDVYLADSMQFVLEYFLRFQEGLPGAYYVSPSFRGEDPDATHLNQFYHIECELLGNMDAAISVAESFVAHITQQMLKKHSQIILRTAGTLSHAQDLLKKLEGGKPLPRVTLEQAIPMMPSPDCLEWVQEGQPQFGRKLTRKGERVLIEKYSGVVWLTEMDHLGVPFYQAYVEGSGRSKAKAADLLLGLGETVGLGERHPNSETVQEALRHHAVPEESYKWYINMRQVVPLRTSGWGMGTERYLCWLLQHNDVRDMHIIPRMKAKKYMP
ncbi:hypothetical protein AALO_G00079160 [Alosa alosa]|uniref:Isoaspartyl peptidase/L-asparaginase n=1 Tax=Alosa alosa TaxID=278164 RepID=A0AAV6GXA2_9TELE|nr:hypothetical protein AALO_G00079160 [Alosa alosa]